MKSFKFYLCIIVLFAFTSFNFTKNAPREKAPESLVKSVITQMLEKAGKVKLDLYVMSFCPYGVNAEKTLVPILEELGDKIDFNIFYIVNEAPDKTFQSLHGEPEVLENRRQLVIARNFPSVFPEYLLHRSSDYNKVDWTKSALAAGLDVDCINSLMDRQEEIEAFRANIANSNTKKIFGSPTLFINGNRFQGSFSLGAVDDNKKCEGGYNDGEECPTGDCPKACQGVPGFKRKCTVDSECGVCNGGLNPGEQCNNNDQCKGACYFGPNIGNECVTHTPCGLACLGGSNDGGPCTIGDASCTGGGVCIQVPCINRGTCNTSGTCTDIGKCMEDWYHDGDGDGYYGETTRDSKSPGSGWKDSPGPGKDCDDNDPTVYPGASEPCGPPDRNCDNITMACPTATIKLNTACQSGHTELSWETDLDISADVFVIERSTDGEKWQRAGSIDAPGINLAYQKHSFTDMSSDETSNFYRIIVYDSRGGKRYSDLVGSPCPSIQNLAIKPNPVTDLAVVSMPSLENVPIEFALYNSKGIVMQAKKTNLHVGKNQFQFYLGKLPAGIYILTGKTRGFLKKFKIIKN